MLLKCPPKRNQFTHSSVRYYNTWPGSKLKLGGRMKFLNQVLGDIDVFHVFLMEGQEDRHMLLLRTLYLLKIQYSRYLSLFLKEQIWDWFLELPVFLILSKVTLLKSLFQYLAYFLFIIFILKVAFVLLFFFPYMAYKISWTQSSLLPGQKLWVDWIRYIWSGDHVIIVMTNIYWTFNLEQMLC